MQTWLITGGAGFIGANFVHYALTQTSYRLVIVDKLTYAGNLVNLAQPLRDPRVVFVQADIADPAAIAALLAQYQPQGLFNFAAETHVDRSIDDPNPFLQSNTVGVCNLLECVRAYRRQQGSAPRLLHVSTDEVYGTLGATGSFSETTPYAPNSPYAASKAAADHFVRAYHHTYGLDTVITNCSNNYGPYQFPEKLIPLMLLNALEGKSLPIYGDGLNVRDWLYVEDHCSGIHRVFEAGCAGEKYNIGGQQERTNLQVLDTLCELLEAYAPAAQNPHLQRRGLQHYAQLKIFVADRPGHDRRYAIDATKIQQQLGWQPGLGFAEGMRRTVLWYLEHQDWCQQVTTQYQRQRLGAL